MKQIFTLLGFSGAILLLNSSCNEQSIAAPAPRQALTETAVSNKPLKIATAAEILAKKEVPILCYHNIRDWKESDSKTMRDYIVPINTFKEQMKMLADSGYKTILPEQLYNYLLNGVEIPEKSVMITFDDTDVDQFTDAKPELDKYGFKGVFFIMTVAIGKPNYMTKDQIKQLSDEGHTIGSHTYDHQNVKKYGEKEWKEQIEKPTEKLKSITGKPVEYFAYPFGLWNTEGIQPLKDRGMLAAFQLSAKRDPNDPLHSIRRIIVPGSWSASTMLNVMKRSFK